MRVLSTAVLGSAILAMSTLASAGAPEAGLSQGVLLAHNRERAQMGMRPLRWSARLAGEAQNWADSLARRGTLEHSDGRGDIGENLWMGTAGSYGMDEMMGAFLSEKAHFRPGRFPNVSRTGNWYEVGHYSQVIWPATQEVGCALAQGRGNDVLVCRYWPAGNIEGEQIP